MDLITVDADRVGTESFIERQIRLAVGDIQRVIEFYRFGHESTYQVDDVSEDGFASVCELPASANLREIYHTKVGDTCVRRSVYPYPYSNRHDLRCGVVNVGSNGSNFLFAVDPQLTKLWVYPRITAGYSIQLVWDGRKTDFEDDDETPFDEPMASLVAEYVKWKIVREVDRDVKLATDYERTYRQGLSRLYLEIKDRQLLQTSGSNATCVPNSSCSTCGTSSSSGCGCDQSLVVSMVNSVGTVTSSCESVTRPQTTFVAFGDSGETSRINDTIAVATAVKAFNPDFILHMGDCNYPAGDPAGLQDNFFKHYYGYLQEDLYFCFGNHDLQTDYGSSILDCIGKTRVLISEADREAGKLFYEFAVGSVRFFVLNSGINDGDENLFLAEQVAWLQSRAMAASEPWLVAVVHRAPYTSDVNYAPGIEMFRLNFKNYGIDLVLSAHAHNYERLLVGGLPYIVCGLGGATKRGKTTNEANLPDGSQFFYNSQNGFLACTAETGKLQVELINTNGNVVDRLILEKQLDPDGNIDESAECRPRLYYGYGDPNGEQVGAIGSIYTDLDTNNIWTKVADDCEATGWA